MFVNFSYGCKNIVFELNTMNHAILIFFAGNNGTRSLHSAIQQKPAHYTNQLAILIKLNIGKTFRLLANFNFFAIIKRNL